ncbi:hypothetical protein P9W99_24455 [Bacillus cereus]|uniref:hypothetical protein n=1 Tax=Bacillus cereus group TaxID=86661 RepID=UPI00039E4DD7|nr:MULTISPECIES: hypothetical protein [Bacillus cereus group]OTZ42478.1 hypothetical protein BK760_10700 [Bacillus thuringiensis serovar tolworthi]AHZ54587.1 hypothetical protein YBT1520_30399 [Bacillus thuringiensis serovar kurstaki str. YBT-1520]AIE37640.1 hypothetical protein BTK_30204 [Bacillus thuringiensis serovar kurstaki str. HD-1]AIM35006.1 hypothetical protein DF16_pBMB400orf00171 [Bacillus thuringiensis serovar kurstaki str. YBT-1520]AKJ62528.1 hypothetical protein XI92_30685 [Bacil
MYSIISQAYKETGKGVPADASKDKIKRLYEEIKKLKEDKQNLIIQLVEMSELKGENRRLREFLEKIRNLK